MDLQSPSRIFCYLFLASIGSQKGLCRTWCGVPPTHVAIWVPFGNTENDRMECAQLCSSRMYRHILSREMACARERIIANLQVVAVFKRPGRHFCVHSWNPPPLLPPMSRHRGPKDLTVLKNGPRWLPDGSQIDQQNTKNMFDKSSDIFSKMTFDHPQTSPKLPRRLTDHQKRLTKTIKT